MTDWAREPATNVLLSGENTTLRIDSGHLAWSGARIFRVATSHRLTMTPLLLEFHVASVLPSGENVAPVTSVCPEKPPRPCPVARSKRFTVFSVFFTAKVLPSGESEKTNTLSVWPLRGAAFSVATSQR